MRIAVILSSTREGRFSEIVSRWFIPRLEERAEVDVLDLRDHQLPYFDATPPAAAPRDYPSPEVAALGAVVDRADGFVVLTAEYNHGYSAVLKSALDATFHEWTRKPISFVGWGDVGGARAIEQLRQVAVEMEMAPLRRAVHILPDVLVRARQAPDDVHVFDQHEQKLNLLITDLLWWAAALKQARSQPNGS